LSLIYRLGIDNKKVDCNPAKLLKHKRENDGKVRFLNQFSPDEETRLREAIAADYEAHMPELDIALNTGMRRSSIHESIGIAWILAVAISTFLKAKMEAADTFR